MDSNSRCRSRHSRRHSRSPDPAASGIPNRQERQIVLSGKGLDDFLP